MRKKLSYLLLFLFIFVVSYPSLRAEDEDVNRDSITCKYEVPISGASGVSSNPIITLQFRVNGSNIGMFMNNTRLQYIDTINNGGINITSNEKVDNYYFSMGNVMLFSNLKTYLEENRKSNGSLVCPDLEFKRRNVKVTNAFRFEGTREGQFVDVIELFQAGSNAGKKLYQLDAFGEVITGDKDSTSNKKFCKTHIKSSAVLGDKYDYDVLQFGISSYEDGAYYFEINGEGDTVSSTPSAWGGVSKVWQKKVLNKNFVIRNSEWGQIKDAFLYNAFPVNENGICTVPIRVTCSKGTIPSYCVVSIQKVNDVGDGKGVLVDGSYDPNEDSDINIDVNPDNVSAKSGTCSSYLGVAGEGDNIATLLDKIYTLIKLGSIIVVILMSSLEFANSVTKNKDDLMDVVKRFAKRLIIMVIILLLPSFIDLLGSLFGIEDILCGIK